MGQIVPTPSSGPISVLDMYRCMTQNPTAVPPTGLATRTSLMNGFARQLIPTDNVWVTNNATMGMDSYRNRRGMLTVYTVAHKVSGSTNYHGWSVRSGSVVNPLGTGPAAGFNFALTDGGTQRHLNIQEFILSTYSNTVANIFMYVGGGDYRSWGAATVWLYAGNEWHSITSTGINYAGGGTNSTYWTFNILGNTSLINRLQSVGSKIYLCVAFVNY